MHCAGGIVTPRPPSLFRPVPPDRLCSGEWVSIPSSQVARPLTPLLLDPSRFPSR